MTPLCFSNVPWVLKLAEISSTIYAFHFHNLFFLVSPVRYCFLPPHFLGQYCLGEVIATTVVSELGFQNHGAADDNHL